MPFAHKAGWVLDYSITGSAALQYENPKFGTACLQLQLVNEQPPPASITYPVPQTNLNDFTFECWIKPLFQSVNFQPVPVDLVPVITVGGLYFSLDTFQLTAPSPSYNIYFHPFGDSNVIPGWSLIYRNQWSYIAMCRTGSAFRFYVNGEGSSQQRSNPSGPPNNSNVLNVTNVKVGGVGIGTDNFMTAQIDSVRVSNVARYTDPVSCPVPTQAFSYDSQTIFLANYDASLAPSVP